MASLFPFVVCFLFEKHVVYTSSLPSMDKVLVLSNSLRCNMCSFD